MQIPTLSRLAIVLAQTPQLSPAAEKDVEKVTGVLRTLGEILPASDLLVGVAMLVFIVLVHGLAMRLVQLHCIRRGKVVAQRPTVWRADLLFAGAVAFMLGSHLVETVIWTTLLVWGHLVHSWRDAGYFVANTYTTLGYGNVVLDEHWKMLCSFIAISGLFTFGWTGSVLVDVVVRVGRLKELAEGLGPPVSPSAPTPVAEPADITKG